MSSDKRQLVKNTIASGAAQVVQMAASLVFMPFLVHTFGLGNFGLYMLSSSVAGYASLLDLGVGSSVVKFVSEHTARDERDEVGKVVSSALAFYLVVGLVAAATFVVLALVAGSLFKITTEDARLVRNLLLVAAGIALFSWPASTAYHVIGGMRRYDLLARNQIVGACANAVVTLAVILANKGPLALMLGNAMVGLAVAGLNVYAARRLLEGIPVRPTGFSRATIARILQFSWAVFVAQLTLVILYQQTDRIVLGVFAGAAAVGLYEAAGKFQGLISQLIGMTNTAIMPTASHLHAEDRQAAMRQLFLRGSKYVCAIINPVVVVLIVLAEPIIGNWLGPSFLPIVSAAQILVSYQLLTAGTSVGDSMIVGLGRLPRRVPYIVAIALANLLLSLALVERFGVMGVVVGTAVPWYLEYPSHIRFLLKNLGVSFRDWFKHVIASTYPLLLVPAAASWLASRAGLTESLYSVCAVAGASILLYWAAVYAIGLSSDERNDVRSLLLAVEERLKRN